MRALPAATQSPEESSINAGIADAGSRLARIAWPLSPERNTCPYGRD